MITFFFIRVNAKLPTFKIETNIWKINVPNLMSVKSILILTIKYIKGPLDKKVGK